MIVGKEANGTRFHGDAPILLIDAVVEQLELPSLFLVNYSIGGDEAVSKGGLSMVYMGYNRDIANALSLRHESMYFLDTSVLADHCCSTRL